MAVGEDENAAHSVVATGNKNERLMEKYMVPPVTESQFRIAYTIFGHANFHLRVM